MAASIIILDTETTGRPKGEDRICQIGFLSDHSGEWQAYDELCNPGVPILSDAMAIHHITNEMVADKPALCDTEAFRTLKRLNTPENIMVIQNAPFDLGVLRNEGFIWQGRVVDTLVCAKHLLDTRRHALQYLRYELGLYKHEAAIAEALEKEITPHDALSDVIVTKLLLNHLLELAGNDMENLLQLSGAPVLLQSVGFGKYKGRKFAEVVLEDQDYFRWVLREFRQLTPDARATIEYWFTQAL